MDHEYATTRGSEQSIRRMHRPLALLLVACIQTFATIGVCLSAIGAPSEPGGIQEQFDEAYQAWGRAISTTPEAPQMFTASFSTALPEFKRMTALGIRAAPYLLQKIRESPEGRARLLLSAFIDVTKKRFSAEEIGSAKQRGVELTELYIQWWEHAIEDTGNKFATLSEHMDTAKADGNDEATFAAVKGIIDLGVLVLPHVMDKVRDGDANMVPVVAVLTDGAVGEHAPILECERWWMSNKVYWVLGD